MTECGEEVYDVNGHGRWAYDHQCGEPINHPGSHKCRIRDCAVQWQPGVTKINSNPIEEKDNSND